MSRLVLQIVGQPGSGKSEVCQYLAGNYDFSTVLVSDLISKYAAGAGVQIKERQDYKLAHSQMLRELGNMTIVESVLSVPTQRVSVDGMRVPAHSAKLHEYGPIIALHCPAELRYPRAIQRGDSLDKPNFDDFLRDEEQEYRSDDPFVQSTLTVMESADFSIDSSVPLPQVLDEISSVVEPLIN